MLRRWMTGMVAMAVLVAVMAPATAAPEKTQGVVVLNSTRFEPLAHDVVIPEGPPGPLHADPDGNIHAGLTEPVLGNDTASDVTMSLSAYLAQ